MSNTNSIVISIIVYQSLILNVIDEVINKDVKKQRPENRALGHTFIYVQPVTPCTSNFNTLLSVW